jgi:autotransporter-associated beta strand protein
MIPVRFTFLLLLVGLIVFPLVVRADNGTWAGDLSGSWSDPAKWVGPTVADGADYTASFATNISVALTVTLDSSRTIGHLTFQDTSSLYQGWTLAGTNVLTLAVGSGTPQVNVKTASATAGATISLTLSGTNGLEKLGVGPLVLSGTNTVSGGVTISQGALTVAADGNLGAAANDIIFAGGAQLTAGGFATARNMVINAGAVATNSVAGLFTVNGSISGSGTLRKADTGVLVLNGTNTYGATVIAAGELRATDGVGVSSGNVNILGGGVWSSSANISRALGLGDDQVQFTGDAGFSAYGAPIDVNLGGGADSISWGAGAFGTPTPFYLNNINANAMLTLRNAINLNGNTAQISTLANVAELAGVISNSTATAGLTKAGSGVLWLTATNAFNGTITVDGAGGALRAVDGIGIPSTVNVNLSNDGVWESPVDITRPLGTNASEVRLTGAGGDGFSAYGAPIRVDLGGAGATLVWGSATFTTGLVLNQMSADNAITLVNGLDLNGGGRTVIVNSPVHAAIISGVISHSSGSAMLTKSGAGTLILGATNTWSHTSVTGTNLNIVAGVVQVEREENLGGNPAGVFMAKCLLLNGGTLKTTASCSIDDSNRGITLGGAHGWFDVAGGTVLTIDNVIAGTTGNLYKRGGGTLILANTSNTYGTTTVGTHLQEGVLAISADGNLGAVSADLYFDTNSTLKATATATLNSGRAVSIAAGVNATVECDASVVLTLAGAISSGPGALTKTGPGTLILGGLNLHDGGTIIEAGTLKCGLANTFAAGTTGDIVINADGILDVGGVGIAPNGMVSGSGTIDNSAGTGTLALGAGNGSSTFDGVVKNSGGTLNLTKTGTGTFTLTNPTNSYGGLTTISGGTIKLGASEVIPHGAGKGNIAITTANTCILDMNGHDETINGFGTSAGLVTNSTGSALLTIGADGLTVASSSVVIKDGGPSAPLALTKTGTGTHTLAGIISLCGPVTIDGGTLILSGANTYTNMTRINTGATLQAGAAANKLSDFSDVIVNGGTLNMTYADAVSSVTLKNNGSITNVATLTSMAGYIVESGTIASALASAAGLTKNTSGTVDLGGANTYAGATVVNDGILRITASDRLANVSALTVNGGAFDLGSYNDQVGVVTLIGGTITSSGGMLTGSVYYVESGTITAKLGGIGIALNKAASGTVILSGDNT